MATGRGYRHLVAGTAPGWHPDPAGRWQVRWWDGVAWTDRVATGGRLATDPVPGGEATAALVNRVVATALGYVDLAESLAGSVPAASVVTALWRDAEGRRDVLVLAHGHLTALERQGTERARALALAWLSDALSHPPLMAG